MRAVIFGYFGTLTDPGAEEYREPLALRDILDYSERTRTERRRALDQMAADAEDDDLYEITLDSPPSR